MKLKDPNKIQAIYDATLKLVKENGIAALNMSAIAKESGLGVGTMYGYFKSKEELINSLFRKLKGVNTQRIYSGIKPGEPFKISLKNLFNNYIENRIHYFEEHYFVEQCSNSHFLDPESKKIDQDAYTGVYDLLNRGKKELLVKNIDNAVLTAHMIGSSNELVTMCLKHHVSVNKLFLDQAFSLCWDSIKR